MIPGARSWRRRKQDRNRGASRFVQVQHEIPKNGPRPDALGCAFIDTIEQGLDALEAMLRGGSK
jgi:hypothetical protein